MLLRFNHHYSTRFICELAATKYAAYLLAFDHICSKLPKLLFQSKSYSKVIIQVILKSLIYL